MSLKEDRLQRNVVKKKKRRKQTIYIEGSVVSEASGVGMRRFKRTWGIMNNTREQN
jgi:hypothetical protein